MTICLGSRAAGRPLAARALLAAAVAVIATLPGPASAQDCTLNSLSDWVSSGSMRDVADENFDCLRQRIEALEQERDTLARRIEQLADRNTIAATVYLNRNGRISRDERHLGPATFVLNGDRRGRPKSLELDHDRMVEMCADAEGCLINLGLRGVVIDGEPVAATFSIGPCPFHLDADTNDWALSGSCVATDLPAPLTASADESGPVWGRDGDARPLGDAGGDGQMVLGLGGACLLAESRPNTRRVPGSPPRFERDTRPDFYLVTTGERWAPDGAFPSALLPLERSQPDFQCSLVIRD